MAMALDTKDVEAAEQQLKGMTHSEQHYFNRYVLYTDNLLLMPKYRDICYAAAYVNIYLYATSLN